MLQQHHGKLHYTSLSLHDPLHPALCLTDKGWLFLQGQSEQGPHQSALLRPQPPLPKAKRLHRVPAAARVQRGLEQNRQGCRTVQRPAFMTTGQHNQRQLLGSKQLQAQHLQET